MRIIIACECSGVVREAFRKKGHDAFSCDIQPADDNSPYHLQGDIFKFYLEKWDMMIAHPECKYLCITANKWYKNNPERWQARVDALIFVKRLMEFPIKKIAIENPVGAISTAIRKPDQYIQPFQYGHTVSKKTGLWLKNLPLLIETNVVEPEWITFKSGNRMSKDHYNTSHHGDPEMAKIRATTYQGIANAMAEQWG